MEKAYSYITRNTKFLILLLLLFSLIGYIEWGGNQHAYLFQAEWELFSKIITTPSSIFHPIILLPLLCQLLLFISLFLKNPNTIVLYFSILGIGLLLGFIFLIGCFLLHAKIILSTLPYLLTALYTFFTLKRKI